LRRSRSKKTQLQNKLNQKTYDGLDTYDQTDILFQINRINKLLQKKKIHDNHIFQTTKSIMNHTKIRRGASLFPENKKK